MQITLKQALRYEVASSWWAWMVPERLQARAAKYFSWKTRRKYAAYQRSFSLIEEMNSKIKVL